MSNANALYLFTGGKNKKPGMSSEENDNEDRSEQASHLTVFYQLRAMPIKFFGLPFTIERTTHYQCAYGCKYYKSRTGLSKMVSCLTFDINIFSFDMFY